MSTQRFKSTIANSGAKVVVPLPFDPNEVWGVKQRHHVTGSINGCTIRGPLDSDGAHYFLSLGAAWRRDSGVETGAQVEVTLAPEGPQTGALAPDIAAALDSDPQAKAFFESLATFYRKGYMRWIDGAKRPETRRARISEMIRLLQAGKKER
jgi:hypothetical protein